MGSEEFRRRAAARSADPLRGADAFRPPAAVEAYFREVDREGRAAAAASPWWQRLLAERLAEGDWVHDWPRKGGGGAEGLRPRAHWADVAPNGSNACFWGSAGALF